MALLTGIRLDLVNLQSDADDIFWAQVNCECENSDLGESWRLQMAGLGRKMSAMGMTDIT